MIQPNNSRLKANGLFSVAAGGKVTYATTDAGGRNSTASSLYGGIVNSVGESAVVAERLVEAIILWGGPAFAKGNTSKTRRRIKKAPYLAGLYAALRMSHRFKSCFEGSNNMVSKTWYLQHIRGEDIIQRLERQSVGERLSESTFGVASRDASAAFGEEGFDINSFAYS